jgi:hypothetical protein
VVALFVTVVIWQPLKAFRPPADPDEPPVMRTMIKWEWIWVIFVMTIYVLPTSSSVVVQFLTSTPMFFLTFFVLPAAVFWLLGGTRRRFLRRVFTDDAEHCLNCGYLLIGLPRTHICPECGVNYDVHEVKLAWVRYLRKLVKQDRRWRTVLRPRIRLRDIFW